MKKIYLLTTAVLLTLLMGACNVVVVTPEPDFSASNLTVDSNYSDDTGPYICNDATTEITYSFDYEGNLRRWTQALVEYDPKGNDTGSVTYEEVIRPENRDADITGDTLTYTFTIQPDTALEPVQVQLAPQQIKVVVDTRLEIEATGTDGQTEVLSVELPTKCLEE